MELNDLYSYMYMYCERSDENIFLYLFAVLRCLLVSLSQKIVVCIWLLYHCSLIWYYRLYKNLQLWICF